MLKLWYLSQVNLIQHHQAGAPVVVDQPPEVLDGVGQRMLGDDEGGGLPVALQESEEGDTSQKTLPPAERRSGVPHNLLTGFLCSLSLPSHVDIQRVDQRGTTGDT